MRPGCDRPVAACLTYDTEVAAVWLDRPVTDGEPAQQVCSVHAATLTAPLGWTVTDRRLLAVGSRSAADVAESSASSAEPERRTDEIELDEIVPDGVERREVEPVPIEANEPHEDAAAASNEASGNGLPAAKPAGKLLDRAFAWTGPQHSVLTTGHDHRPQRSPDT